MADAEGDYRIGADSPEAKGQLVRQRLLESAEKENRIVALRRNGLTYEQIALALDQHEDRIEISPDGVRDTVERYLGRMARENDDAGWIEKQRSLALDRLDGLTRRLAEQVASGSVKAIRAQLAVEERRARLLGLDAPAKVAVAGKVHHLHDVADPDHVAAVEEDFQRRYAVEGNGKPKAELEPAT